jgi:hypothetical protein
MGGSILFTVLFVLAGGFPLFTLAWVGNRRFQSMGWVGLVKVASVLVAHQLVDARRKAEA